MINCMQASSIKHQTSSTHQAPCSCMYTCVHVFSQERDPPPFDGRDASPGNVHYRWARKDTWINCRSIVGPPFGSLCDARTRRIPCCLRALSGRSPEILRRPLDKPLAEPLPNDQIVDHVPGNAWRASLRPCSGSSENPHNLRSALAFA